MSKHVPLVLASALLLTAPAGAALADSTAAFGAANAAQLRGYTASPAQLYIQPGGPGAGFVPVPAPERPRAPTRTR